jgi:hypothetical protein
MRILTLVTGENSLPDAVSLTGEIRSFNAEIDFRLRFLHIEIEEIYAAIPELREKLAKQVERLDFRPVRAASPLEAAAGLALLLNAEKPDIVVVTGRGALLEPGVAAARACGATVAFFGAERGNPDALEGDVLDLGDDPHTAVARMTGVAREIS